MANVMIDIAAEFVGNKAFKQADSATDKLTKNVKKLAGAFGLAFGTTQILAYGKAAIKAAAEDEKAQKQLALALKNVGLGRDAASSEAYIQSLQSEFGILDDKLRPAYQTLAIATRDTTKAQQLLNLSLDISAATGKDLSAVTAALSRAFLGNNTALSKLGVGIDKADLKAGKFEDIIAQLETTFKGAATQSANTFQGSIDKLAVASANASEIIGTGLIDALKNLGDQDSVDNLATAMQNTAIYIADVIRGIGVLAGQLNKLPGFKGAGIEDYVQLIPILGSYLSLLAEAGRIPAGSGIDAQGLAHLAELQSSYVIKTLEAKKKLTALEAKALKDAKLKLAIDKANLALNKGNEVFDMDKIQNAAALKNQAEQLAKSTTDTQRLQIANDTARLNVKQSISNLEDAIAAKDEAAIVKATEKLNADLKILGALTNQDLKLKDIKSILEGLKPAELINQANLDEALRKIREMLNLLTQANTASKAQVPTSGSLGSGIPAGDFIAPISTAGGSIAAILEYADAAAARANAFADLLDMDTAAKTAALQTSPNYDNSGALQSFRQKESATYNISIQSGLGDPNAIAEALDQVLREAQQRGTLTTIGAFDR